MPVSFLTHQDRQIFFIDYSGLKRKEDMMKTLKEAVSMAAETEGPLRTLIDISNASGSPEWLEESKKQGKEIRDKAEKTAIIGVTGIKKILLMGYNTVVGGRVKPFNSKDEALAYLSKD